MHAWHFTRSQRGKGLKAMRNLRPCGHPPLQHFGAIAKEKESPQCEQLLALQPRIEEAYGKYTQACPALESLVPLSVNEDERKALLHCYESETKPLTMLKGLITASQSDLLRAECQYCCASPPRTYDHYLPRSEYPEFAVHLRNLLPCCADCNRDRGAGWKNARGERVCVHLYDDVIEEDMEILVAEIDVSDLPSATFKLDMGRARIRPFYQLLERHITKLKLLAKYALCAPARLSDHHQTIYRLGKRLGRAEILQDFREHFEQERELYGVHHWRVALLRAVLQTQKFIQWSLDTPPSIWKKRDKDHA
jgi:hypothetical protein